MIHYLALVAAPFLLSSATVTHSDVPVTCGKTNALQQLISHNPQELGSRFDPDRPCVGGPNVQISKDEGNYVIDEAGGFPQSSRAVELGLVAAWYIVNELLLAPAGAAPMILHGIICTTVK